MKSVYQRTIKNSIQTKGIGLHSGKEVVLTLKASAINTGICFVRCDLHHARIPMDAFLVQDTTLSSNLIKDHARIGTVEHLLSAVASMGIDNLIIEVSAPELPIMDGSAMPFLTLLNQAGIQEQSALKKFIKIKKPIQVMQHDKWASIQPSNQGFMIDFEIDFDHPFIRSTKQRCHFHFSSNQFAQKIARARTFGFLKDLEALQSNHLALGGSLHNAIVLDDDGIINEDGLRYPNEFVRHKILDAIGDLYIIGHPILGEFSAYKSGHHLNNQLIRAILSDPECYEIVTFYDKFDCPIAYEEEENALNIA